MDLLFRGIKTPNGVSGARVALVFDNVDRVFGLPEEGGSTIPLDFDELTISRAVFRDGSAEYRINDHKVRLKDVMEVIAQVHIGASGHHIISQGEADRLLNASPKQRKEMLEESLGLKTYHSRIKEARRKLEKTQENLSETSHLKRELTPQMRYLEKQVQKIHEAKELRIELADFFSQYSGIVSVYLDTTNEYHKRESMIVRQELTEVNDEIQKLKSLLSVDSNKEKKQQLASERIELQNQEREIREKVMMKDRIEGSIGSKQEMIQMLQVQINAPEPQAQEMQSAQEDVVVSIQKSEVKRYVGTVDKIVDFDSTDTEKVQKLQNHAHTFSENLLVSEVKMPESPTFIRPDFSEKITGLQSEISEMEKRAESKNLEIQTLEERTELLRELVKNLEENLVSADQSAVENQSRMFEMASISSSLESKLVAHGNEIQKVRNSKDRLGEEVQEAIVLLGRLYVQPAQSDVTYRTFNQKTHNSVTVSLENQRRMIERKKLKLESVGVDLSGDTEQEFETLRDRIEFFEVQIQDMVETVAKLQSLLSDLTTELESRFKKGLTQVSSTFNEFFGLMFGGGKAKLELVDILKKEGEGEDIREVVVGLGAEVSVELPRKKVQRLEMLSGGERSLTSIALLFALAHVNPPPFLVLDETDAALDEANSRRYGDMVQRLAGSSQLLVVTHNRETMSRANVLYGVTLDQDGASKLLSVKLDEAAQYAK
jgi:chromosome segregation protein